MVTCRRCFALIFVLSVVLGIRSSGVASSGESSATDGGVLRLLLDTPPSPVAARELKRVPPRQLYRHLAKVTRFVVLSGAQHLNVIAWLVYLDRLSVSSLSGASSVLNADIIVIGHAAVRKHVGPDSYELVVRPSQWLLNAGLRSQDQEIAVVVTVAAGRNDETLAELLQGEVAVAAEFVGKSLWAFESNVWAVTGHEKALLDALSPLVARSTRELGAFLFSNSQQLRRLALARVVSATRGLAPAWGSVDALSSATLAELEDQILSWFYRAAPSLRWDARVDAFVRSEGR